MKEMDEGLGDFLGNVKGKAMAGLKTLVDPFKLAKTEEDFLNVMKNMIPDSGDEGKSDEKWLKQWNFLKDQYLNSPTVEARWENSWDADGHAKEEAEILASAAMEEPIIDPALEENKTKLTKSQLKQIIKEEVGVLLNEGREDNTIKFKVGDKVRHRGWLEKKGIGEVVQMDFGWLNQGQVGVQWPTSAIDPLTDEKYIHQLGPEELELVETPEGEI